MELNKNAEVDTSRSPGRRFLPPAGGGCSLGGLPIPLPGGLGGGVVGLVVLALLVVGGLVGGNSLLGDGGGPSTGEEAVNCPTSDPNRFNDVRCRDALYVNSIQNYWQTALPPGERGRLPAGRHDLLRLLGEHRLRCGRQRVGPFYCPTDDQVYIDLSFWDELSTRFGAEGEFAQPYVLAHEYAHHIQDLDGTEAEMRRQMERDPGNQNAYSVKLELRGRLLRRCGPSTPCRPPTPTGSRCSPRSPTRTSPRALDAAAAVGDDAIQKKMGGQVDESQFTHGSSAERQKWFATGFGGGDPKACNTFGA